MAANNMPACSCTAMHIRLNNHILVHAVGLHGCTHSIANVCRKIADGTCRQLTCSMGRKVLLWATAPEHEQVIRRPPGATSFMACRTSQPHVIRCPPGSIRISDPARIVDKMLHAEAGINLSNHKLDQHLRLGFAALSREMHGLKLQ